MKNKSGTDTIVRATEPGIAKLIATMNYEGEEYTSYCTITVSGVSVVPPDEIETFAGKTQYIYVGDTAQMIAYTFPLNQHVTWYSSDESVAVVDRVGTVMATGVGSAKITAEMNYNGRTYISSCMVVTAEK